MQPSRPSVEVGPPDSCSPMATSRQDGLVIVKGALGKVTNLAGAPLTPLQVVVV